MAETKIPDGLIVINKEKGFTSHDVVNIVKKTLNVKAGHTGTLDPAAEGVLPVCIGKATKISSYVMADKKRYRAVVMLGIETDTLDITGSVLKTSPVDFDEDRISAAVKSFIGSYMQTPPMYSAIKINGKKLYELARKGEEIHRESRLVHIYSIEIIAFSKEENSFTIDVSCSKGTYIRSLCADIGAVLSCGGCMGYLVRTESGLFSIDKAITIGRLKSLAADGLASSVIISIQDALPSFPIVLLPEKLEKPVINGNSFQLSAAELSAGSLNTPFDLTEGSKVLALFKGKAAGIYLITGGFFKPVTMLL